MESALKMKEKGCWIPRGRENLESYFLEKTLVDCPMDLDLDRELYLDGKTLDLDPTMKHTI
jgi:hypothetical protein